MKLELHTAPQAVGCGFSIPLPSKGEEDALIASLS